MVADLWTGEDWAGRRFTSVPELIGRDDKGVYRTTRKGRYEKGEPKGGKLKGELVAKSSRDAGKFGYQNYPSWLAYEARSSMPIPIQQGIAWLTGEIDGFDAITKSLGMMTATDYPLSPEQREEKILSNARKLTKKRPTKKFEWDLWKSDIEAALQWYRDNGVSYDEAWSLYKKGDDVTNSKKMKFRKQLRKL